MNEFEFYLMLKIDVPSDTVHISFSVGPYQEMMKANKGWESIRFTSDDERLSKEVRRCLENYGLKGWKLNKTMKNIYKELRKQCKQIKRSDETPLSRTR